METLAPPTARWPGPAIRTLRDRIGVTQAVMAEWLGYAVPRSVSDLENGRQKPSTSVCILLDLIDAHDGLPTREVAA